MKFINMPLSEKEKRMIRECSQPDPEQPKQPKSPEEQRRIATMAFDAVCGDKMATTATVSLRPICRHGNGWFATIRFWIFRKRVFFCTDCEQAIYVSELKKEDKC